MFGSSAWSQSIKPDASLAELEIEVSVVQRNFSGNGKTKNAIILPFTDVEYRLKSMNRFNHSGSIIYVESENYCFFISLYFAIQHSLYLNLRWRKNTEKQKKEIHLEFFNKLKNEYYNLIEETDEKVTLEKAKKYFWQVHKIDIVSENEKISSRQKNEEQFLMEFYQKSAYQVSIFCANRNLNRVLIVPEKYDNQLAQLHLLRVKYLVRPDKTIQGNIGKDYGFHFHALNGISRQLFGTEKIFCPFCNEFFSHGKMLNNIFYYILKVNY